MRIQDHHAHADCRYCRIDWRDYVLLFKNILQAKIQNVRSLNVHLPFEVQHPTQYEDVQRGLRYIHFGETLKKLFDIKLYWENAPAQNYGTWDLKNGQTQWQYIPQTIHLCLDTGHVMLGAKSIQEARKRISTILKERGKQIRHLHIHENDLQHDTHNPIGKVITKKLFEDLINNRTYIFEKG